MYLEVYPNGDDQRICKFKNCTDVELEIGGQKIDKHYHWMEAWSELTEPNPTGTTMAVSAGMTGPGTFSKNELYGWS